MLAAAAMSVQALWAHRRGRRGTAGIIEPDEDPIHRRPAQRRAVATPGQNDDSLQRMLRRDRERRGEHAHGCWPSRCTRTRAASTSALTAARCWRRWSGSLPRDGTWPSSRSLSCVPSCAPSSRRSTCTSRRCPTRRVQSAFAHVLGHAEGWSGLRFRPLPAGEQAQVEEIQVRLEVLDEILDPDLRPAVIKIDVEGAEQQVLEGAQGGRSNAIGRSSSSSTAAARRRSTGRRRGTSTRCSPSSATGSSTSTATEPTTGRSSSAPSSPPSGSTSSPIRDACRFGRRRPQPVDRLAEHDRLDLPPQPLAASRPRDSGSAAIRAPEQPLGDDRAVVSGAGQRPVERPVLQGAGRSGYRMAERRTGGGAAGRTVLRPDSPRAATATRLPSGWPPRPGTDRLRCRPREPEPDVGELAAALQDATPRATATGSAVHPGSSTNT